MKTSSRSGCLLRLLGAAVFLIPSCVQWNISENILTASERFVGWDCYHPVDEQIYGETRRDGTHRYYARLNEVSYKIMPGFIPEDILYGTKRYEVCGEEPTGRSMLAELDVGRQEPAPNIPPPRLCGVRRAVSALPPGAKPLPKNHYVCDNSAKKRNWAMLPNSRPLPETAPGALRRALATGVAYSIDPLLTVVSTTACWSVGLAAELACLPVLPFLILTQQAAEPDDSSANTADESSHPAAS